MKKILKKCWAWPWQLRRRGVLGINARNVRFLFSANPRRFYKDVDDKLRTKQICRSYGIPIPDLYAVIDRFGDLRHLETLIGPRNEFVIKPAAGAGGRGITVITRRSGDLFYTARDESLTLDWLRYHFSTILSGLYSLGGRLDRALIEQRITPHSVFAPFCAYGTPDLRLILYRRRLVMAMLRLPTLASRGRANLHQGAVGAGIDLASGRTFGGVCRNRPVDFHPDTAAPLAGLLLPHWEHTCDIAVRLAGALGLGYLGVDLLLDEHHGPLVIEANARPGLAIQIANRRGLLDRRQRTFSENVIKLAAALKEPIVV